MPQDAALRAYSFIDEWWGEPLSATLAQKVASAPWAHIRKFARDWPDLSSLWRSGHLQTLEDGSLRPVFGRLRMVEEPTIALRLLMYVPEAVVDARFLEPLAPIEFGDRVDSSATREAIGQTLNWMGA